MALGGYDGSIKIDTKIDNSGFEKGNREQTASLKSQAAKRAAIYRKEGMSQSEAMKKAWSEIERTAKETNSKISSNSKKTSTKIQNNIGTSLGVISNSLKNLAGAVGIAFGIGALVKFGKEALNIASDLQEVENVVNVSFGNMKEMVEDFADTALEKFGMTELQAKKTASTYMAMNKGMGLNGEKAAQMAIDAAGRTGDIASFFNKTQEEADTMMKSIWTGETESLKQIGVVMTENNLNMFAMQKGLGKTTQQMTQQEQVMLRYQYVMEQTSLAAGDFERTSDSWANQTRVLTGRWKEFLGIMGTGLIQMLTPAVKFLNSLMDSLIKFANIFSEVTAKIFGKQELSQGAGSASGAISDAASSANDYAEATDKAKKANEGFLTGLDNITKMSDSSAGGSTFPSQGGSNVSIPELSGEVGGDVQLSPSLQQVIDTISSFVDKLKRDVEPVKKSLQNLASALEPMQDFVFTSLFDFYDRFLKPVGEWVLGEGLPKFIDATANGLGNIDWERINASLQTLWDKLAPFSVSVGDGLLWFYEEVLVPLGTWVLNNAVPTFLDLLSGALSILKPVLDIAKEALQWLWEDFLQPIALWTGGVVASVLQDIADGLTKIGSWIEEHKEGIIDFLTVFSSILAALAIKWGISTAAASAGTIAMGAWNAIVAIGTAATTAFGAVMSFITSPINLVVIAIGALIGIIILCVKHWDEIKAAASKAWEWIKETWNKAADWFNETVVLPIQKFFSGLWEGIKNSFITAFNFIKDALKGYVNGWIFILESFINFFIKGINSLLGMLNKINITAPDWLPIVGGKTFGFNIKSIPTISIPRLATGAVIPPNAEFAAILGDQKKGRNLEAPEGLIRQIVKEESGSGDITVIVQMPDGEEKEVFSTKKINKKNRISGKIIVPVGV